jgi:2-oxo-4-hydroxy-4-carboxy-5-ureidoimidazoline decarboxylase
MTLAELNTLAPEAFVAALGAIFEHSPWVPRAVLAQRPFGGIEALHAAMCAAVAGAGEAAQLTLIRAHPQLAGKAAIADLTRDSQREQRGAGLDQCSPDEFARLTALNDAYHRRHGFPFILAVRGHTRASIIAAMAQRVERSTPEEQAEALRQIERIAALRLADMIQP